MWKVGFSTLMDRLTVTVTTLALSSLTFEMESA